MSKALMMGDKFVDAVFENEEQFYERNLFIIKQAEKDKALKWGDGDTFDEKGSIVSGWIDVSPNGKLISNREINQFLFYDENKEKIIEYTSISHNIKVPANEHTKYMRISFRKGILNDGKIEDLKIKLEKNTKVTDYTLAPEDLITLKTYGLMII